jgi:ribosomal protein S18 acetylase RimI-like enzyme
VEDVKYFHPHALTAEEAERLCEYLGKDLYYICEKDGSILGYAILRGWDEGYKVPSLGVAVRPDARNTGIGTILISFLHVVARWRGVEKIRVKVYSDNGIALNLYKRMGYVFEMLEDGQWVGFLDLSKGFI